MPGLAGRVTTVTQVRLVCVAVGAVVGLAVTGCRGEESTVSGGDRRADADERAPAAIVDVAPGRYKGVSLGSSEARVLTALGRGTVSAGIMPLGVSTAYEAGAPLHITPPCRTTRASPHRIRRYRRLAIMLCNDRVYAMIVYQFGVATERGVKIGDSLAEAERAYPEVDCSSSSVGDGNLRIEYCVGRLGETYVWFGRDPIMSIAVATVALRG